MIRKSAQYLKYRFGVLPTIWQLPNSIKIHEFLELTRDFRPGVGEKVIDLGCGKGLQTQLLAMAGAEVIGIDPSPKRIGLANRELRYSKVRNRVRFFCGTLEEAQLSKGTFDHVISFCVLEHIPNLADVLTELHGLLNDGGHLHATVDCLDNIDDDDFRELHRREHGVVEYFTLDSIEQRLLLYGFEVYEKRHILRSEMAKERLVEEIETGNYLQTPEERKTTLNELQGEETKAANVTRGTMILVRARKIRRD